MGQNEHTILYTFIYTVFFLRNLLWKGKNLRKHCECTVTLQKVFYQSKDVLDIHSKNLNSEAKQTKTATHAHIYTLMGI